MNSCEIKRHAIKSLLCMLFCFKVYAAEKAPVGYTNSEDLIVGQIKIDKNLNTPFFEKHEYSYPWYIIKKDDGSFENAFGDELTKEDTTPIEQTANVISTHQGRHKMSFASAKITSRGIEVEISGGMPAYASTVLWVINGDRFKCFFYGAYPAPVDIMGWKIVSKELSIKKEASKYKEGERIYGKIEMVFEEQVLNNGKIEKTQYSISGYIKPIIEK